MPSETLYADKAQEQGDLWWANYLPRASGLSATAKAILDLDCDHIFTEGLIGDGPAGSKQWPSSRLRSGLVMGAVQSGKTASMFGVAAKAMDARAADVIIVLAGTRISLCKQTMERFEQQLDLPLARPLREARRIVRPRQSVLEASHSNLTELYRVPPARLRRVRGQTARAPIIFFVLKQTDHLAALARSLQQSVFPALELEPFHMVVLDDEADDGSVLDAAVEADEDPFSGNLKQVPRAIQNLWRPNPGVPETLFTTYVAYTATPQANLLQDNHNPLAPRDFVLSLRTPYDHGSIHPRATTFAEPEGLERMYTGGEVFYQRANRAGLCRATQEQPQEDLASAVRAFLVAAAVRLAQEEKLGPTSLTGKVFESREELDEVCPKPISMLVHPAADVASHLAYAIELLTWKGGRSEQNALSLLSSGRATLPDTFLDDLNSNTQAWTSWLDEYGDSSEKLAVEFSMPSPLTVPTWEQVDHLIRQELLPSVRIATVNSSPQADPRPLFEPRVTNGTWMPPVDLCTIFVSGNVMSRGITLEGLTTTVFLRRSDQPLADTQMQMQRWFGYRGQYLHVCRLLAPLEQLRLFDAYHETDEALRQLIVSQMNSTGSGRKVLEVLHGYDYLATGKIANLRQRPLAPGPNPFIRRINVSAEPDPNVALAVSVFESQASEDVFRGVLRGRIVSAPLSLLETADLLDRLRYDGYSPSIDSRVGHMWSGVHARAMARTPSMELPDFYRPPASATTLGSDEWPTCPYNLAAYLRLWDACLTRHVRGIFENTASARRWSALNLEAKQAEQPKFWIGIRYGHGAVLEGDHFDKLNFAVKASARNEVGSNLANGWGSQDPEAGATGYRGDLFFDYYRGAGFPMPSTWGSWRPPGSDGQVLFLLNTHESRNHAVAAVSMSLPAGGPEQIAALTATATGDHQRV